MRGVYTGRAVRAAEAALMAAAARRRADAAGRGRAGDRSARDAARLGLRRARRAARRAPATTAATRCTPAPRLAARGAGVTAVLLEPDRAHAGGLAALRRAGGRVVARPGAARAAPTSSSTGCRHRRPRRAACARPPTLAGGRAATARPSPSTCRPGSTPTPARSADAAVRADVTVTFGALKPGLLVGRGRRAAPARCGSSTSGSTCRAADRRSVLEAGDVRATAARARRRPTTSTPAASSAWSPARAPYPGAGRAVHRLGARTAAPGMVRYAGTRRRRDPRPLPRGGRARGRAPVRACGCRRGSVGPGMGTDDDARRRCCADVLPTDVPVIVDADGLTLLAERPELLRGRDGADRAHPARPRVRAHRGRRGRRPARRGPPGRRRARRRRAAQGQRDRGRATRTAPRT